MNWHHPHSVARRGAASRWIVFVVFGVLLVAFFRAQVLHSSRYELESEENRLRPVPLPAPRALITDRHGVVLADNVPGYSIAIMTSSEDSLRATLEILANYLELDSARIRRIIRRFRRSSYEPTVVQRDAPFDLVSALEESRVKIPRLVIQTEPKRWYPDSSVAAHVVGYVGEISEGELISSAVPGARSGTLVGRDGLERTYGDRLRGKDGVRFVEVDALGRTVRDLVDDGSTLEPQQPDTLRTTLDMALQKYAASVFPSGSRGAVMAMDPRNGDVLALYSSPSFDPNLFVGGMEPEEWQALSGSVDEPLFNRAVGGQYPPASPWKLAVAVSAIKRGIVTLDSKMTEPCRGGYQYGNRYFRCWKLDGHGDITLREAIQYSCDVFFYQLGLKLGLVNLLHDGVELGFRERSGIDLPGEARPQFPGSTEYYDRRFGPRGWTSAVTLNLAIGQGENAQSLSNMLRFYAMLANPRGEAPEPRLVVGDGGKIRSLGLSPSELDGLRDALVQVVQSGTAARSQIADLKIAGKTGTAQNSHGPDHGWFIAFAPADDPVIVVGAIVEFAEHGTRVAPMVTRIIAHHILGPTAPEVDTSELELVLPADSAPESRPLFPDTSLLRGRDSTQSR